MHPTSRPLAQRLAGLRRPALLTALAASAWLTGCAKSGDESSTLTVNGDVAIVYTKRVNSVRLSPVAGTGFAAGGDLMLREKASASAPERNLTSRFTQGAGDVSDPEVSYDGKKIVFAMRCPTSNTATVDDNGTQVKACTGRWNIWEYDMSAGSLTAGTFRRISKAHQSVNPETGATETYYADDVDPAYLPAGKGFVFSSNRQAKVFSLDGGTQALGKQYYALDEYERERVINLHTMDAEGNHVKQISFNQSHDRNPVIRSNGEIMFSRWDHVAGRNHFKIFKVKPDGTDMFVLYGAHSEGNSFLHPREMDPKGAYAGQVVSDLMPLLGTNEGGALVMVDIQNYSEQNAPANNSVPAVGGQRHITAQPLSMEKGLSYYGRATTPYPLWDGTDRILVGYTPCMVSRSGVVTSCTTLTDAERARLSDKTRTREEIASDSVQANVLPAYGIYMFDPAKQTWLIVAAPPAGYIYTDPVAIQPRTEPNVAADTPLDKTLADQGLGLLEVRSVYDTDHLERMGPAVLADGDLPDGCTTTIPKIAPPAGQAHETRTLVADIVSMKDPANPAYLCGPARFVRVIRAVAPPSGGMGLRKAIGETNFEPVELLGYVPIQPDGSFRLLAPADTPLAVSIVDAEGRTYQTHTNWIQVRPGERRTCDGCHSPRRGASLNSGSIVNTVPNAWLAAMKAKRQDGQTMAATYTTTAAGQLDYAALSVLSDLVSTDVWADTSVAGVKKRPDISIKYTGNSDPADDLATPAPEVHNDLIAGSNPKTYIRGVIINYPQHIQPLWERDRGTNTCTRCHNASSQLNLTASKAGIGRLASYQSLMLGEPLLDASGKPVIQMRDGLPEIMRKTPLVDVGASEGEVIGGARKSRLMEILTGKKLMVGDDVRAIYPTPAAPAPNHANMLNKAERRLLAEWMDLGGQYFNNPYDPAGEVRYINPLDQTQYEAAIQPILTSTCANNCHMALGKTPGSNFADNRLVLTGNPEGDFNVALTFVWDVCQPALNPLISRPSTVPHPAGMFTQLKAVLPNDGADFTTMLNWIASGCTP